MDGKFIEKNSWVDVFDKGSGAYLRGQVIDLKKDYARVRMNGVGRLPDTEVNIPSKDISKMVKRAPSALARIPDFETPEDPTLKKVTEMSQDIVNKAKQGEVPEVGDTFESDGKTWTVRSVMPDGTVWANDGKETKATEDDQSLALAPGETYFDGRDKKFAPGEIKTPASSSETDDLYDVADDLAARMTPGEVKVEPITDPQLVPVEHTPDKWTKSPLPVYTKANIKPWMDKTPDGTTIFDKRMKQSYVKYNGKWYMGDANGVLPPNPDFPLNNLAGTFRSMKDYSVNIKDPAGAIEAAKAPTL